MEIAERIAENVACVRGRIAAAASASGRSPEGIALVAVTKYVGPEEIRAVVAAGCTLLGESRPQQLWDRAAALADLPVRWHLIGHLQRNKVRRTLPLVEMVQSADSPRLIAAIDEAAGELGRAAPILLEVNVSGEDAKHGFAPDELMRYLGNLPGLRNVEVRGLMCMAGLGGGAEAARREFASLRELRDRLRKDCPPGVQLDELSMGMSGDYEIAIREGATMVRVGSALFEGLTE
ncbi:MAG: YggS family pyridoxal phosphate-dependent enzyme [Pirellulales bacterium]|nr:YggS family pyridoxal phosphate-dependent enzyme [Pirellulales bacterium]